MTDGYPDDKELHSIESWDMDSGWDRLMEYCRGLGWEQYGSFKKVGGRYRLATGGWSGNESIIHSLQTNVLFWSMCFESAHHGGLFWFRTQRDGDEMDGHEREAYERGFNEGLSTHPESCENKTAELVMKAYREGFSDCREKAARLCPSPNFMDFTRARIRALKPE